MNHSAYTRKESWIHVQSQPPSPYRYKAPITRKRRPQLHQHLAHCMGDDTPFTASRNGNLFFSTAGLEGSAPVAPACAHEYSLSDLPSMASSSCDSNSTLASSFDYGEDDDRWDRKMPAKPYHLDDDDDDSAAAKLGVSSYRTAPANKTIEVAPGHVLRLRDSVETQKAIREGFYKPSCCMCCSLELFCIQDADYVVCPSCKVVSPNEESGDKGGGVGLGFRIEEVISESFLS